MFCLEEEELRFLFFCGLWLSSYLNRTIFSDENDNSKNILFIIFIGIVSIIVMSAAIVANIYNVKGINNQTWVKYNQILFPLYGGLILISEESVRHFIHYILVEKTYLTNSWKLLKRSSKVVPVIK